jgi:hypothetical protein
MNLIGADLIGIDLLIHVGPFRPEPADGFNLLHPCSVDSRLLHTIFGHRSLVAGHSPAARQSWSLVIHPQRIAVKQRLVLVQRTRCRAVDHAAIEYAETRAATGVDGGNARQHLHDGT